MTEKTISQKLGLTLELFKYQDDGVTDIVKRFKGVALLADEMGLGKSCQALAAVAAYRRYPVVIVCPASLRLNWKNEIKLWLLNHVDPMEVCVIKTKKDKLYGKIIIFSYEMAASRCDEIEHLHPQVIIYDESHYIKNKSAIRTKKLVPLAKRVPRRILITGTAILNRPIELWSQLAALGISFGTYWEYARRYCNLKKGRFGWDVSGARNLGELHDRLTSTCMIRRLKKDVLKDLPPKQRVKIVVEGVGLSSEMEDMRAECLQALQVCMFDLEAARTKLRSKKASVSSVIFKAYSEVGVLKIEAACEWIVNNSTPTQPLVVFAHHRAVLDGIQATLKKESITFMRIDGSTSLENRQKGVEDFQAGNLQVALLSITAASTGLTLTKAYDMLIVELPFGPGLAAQAEDRIHRVGQQNAALIRYMIADKTIDDALWGLINKKSSITHGALDGRHESAFKDTEEESNSDYWIIIDSVLTDLYSQYQQQRKVVNA